MTNRHKNKRVVEVVQNMMELQKVADWIRLQQGFLRSMFPSRMPHQKIVTALRQDAPRRQKKGFWGERKAVAVRKKAEAYL